MPYDAALNKAWDDLAKNSSLRIHSISLLGDTYDIRLDDKTVFSSSCNVPAKDYLAILLLHYMIGYLKEGYFPSESWVSFKEIEGGEAYYPAFRKSVIEQLLRKYGRNPEALPEILKRFKGRKLDIPEVSVEIETFPGVMVRLILWKADEEFGPDASMLFDRSLLRIYPMEDITVFSHFIVSSI